MLKQIVITTLGLFLLSGCTDGFRGYFKKSANNKIIDSKGFEGGKRKPLYNKKYISIAKKNIIEENLDDEEELGDSVNSETINPSQRNREMYRKMIKRDAARQKRQMTEDGDYSYNNEKYPSLNNASRKIKGENSGDQEDKLQRELAQIKSMLNDTKKDLAKYNCPMKQHADEISTVNQSHSPAATNKQETNKIKTESKMKKKFLSEDDDNINVTDGDKSTNTKINNNIINDQGEESLLPRAI